MDDPYGLRRFEDAQDESDVYGTAVAQLRAGHKTGHWMWFIFPQIAGLGRSSMSETYAITSLAEAQAYLAHPILGARLIQCTRILTELTGTTARDVFGPIDAMKLRSSMTLFARAAPDNPLFAKVLDGYFDGLADQATDRRLEPRAQ